MKILAMLLLLFSPAYLLAQKTTCHVKYVSGESIYIDAGNADSLAVGDTLRIVHGDSVTATLEISFVAENSSSCKILSSSGEIRVGDSIQLSQKPVIAKSMQPAIDTTQSVAIPTPAPAVPEQAAKPKPARVDGSVAFQLFRFTDRSPSHLNFTQPTMRFNLKANKLFGQDITLTIRTDSRYNMRSRAYNIDVPKNEWRNRIYQFSLGFAGDNAPYNFEVGRILSNKVSGVGYIDGFMAQKRVGNGFQIGGFGGTQPEWQYSNFQTSLQKYGIFVSYVSGSYQKKRFESAVAATGEYHGQIVSREYFFMKNNLNIGGSWNFYQSSEIDMNRSWRKARTGKSLSITNLFLSARGRLFKRLSASLSYDNRKNYWTYETRSLADSLFDSVLRQGIRTDLSLRAGKGFSIFTNFGYNKRSTDTRATYSYGGGVNKSNFLSTKQFFNSQITGFSGPFTDGYNLSLTVGRYLWAGNMLSLGYGAYAYKFNAAGISRLNQWFQTNTQFDITHSAYFSGTFEYDTGKDTKGERLIGELGYRF